MSDNIQLYQIIRVEGETLHYEAHTVTGRLYDAFTLRKRPHQTNERNNKIPPTP